MEVRLKKVGRVKTDIKRLWLPYVLKSKCPECGTEDSYNFNENCIEYPKFEETFEHWCWCEKCEKEWLVNLKLDVTLEIETPF